jgi:hypothetical protein
VSLTDLIGGVRDVGIRFAIVGVFPLATLVLFVIALVWSGAPSDAPDLGQIADEARTLDGWSAALLVLGVLIASFLAQPFQLALVRLLEGYWGHGAVGGRLRALGVARQGRRLRALEAQLGPARTREEALAQVPADTVRGQLFPPDPQDLLPTRLGNALRSGERRAGRAYGLDAVTIWPRLYPLLPDPVRSLVDDRRDQLDLAARLVAVFLLAAGASFVLLLSHGWWLLVPVACAGLAALAYRGAVAAAVAYGDQLCAAIDLHRFELLRALHVPLPATLGEERATNEQLVALLRDGTASGELPYAHDAGG